MERALPAENHAALRDPSEDKASIMPLHSTVLYCTGYVVRRAQSFDNGSLTYTLQHFYSVTVNNCTKQT